MRYSCNCSCDSFHFFKALKRSVICSRVSRDQSWICHGVEQQHQAQNVDCWKAAPNRVRCLCPCLNHALPRGVSLKGLLYMRECTFHTFLLDSIGYRGRPSPYQVYDQGFLGYLPLLRPTARTHYESKVEHRH